MAAFATGFTAFLTATIASPKVAGFGGSGGWFPPPAPGRSHGGFAPTPGEGGFGACSRCGLFVTAGFCPVGGFPVICEEGILDVLDLGGLVPFSGSFVLDWKDPVFNHLSSSGVF